MANLSITALCNRQCRYCFAKNAGNGHMAAAVYVRCLDFIERSGIGQVRLLGGEPTLHPQFPAMVELALGRGLRVLVFSNGLMPEAALRALEDSPAAVLLNVIPQEREQQARALSRLGPRAVLGMNIDTPAFQPDFLLDLIREHNLAMTIRFGLAHPCVGGSNSFLHPRYYRAVGERLARFRDRAQTRGVAIELDCGFVPCMFPAEAGLSIGSGAGCGPVPDLLPDGAAIPCFPLAGVSREGFDAETDAARLRRVFNSRLAVLRQAGIFRECSGCELRESGQCQGGCLAAAMLRLRRRVFDERQETQ